MFDLDPGKMLVFGIVALAVIPPKDLPRVLRTVGKYVGQIRRMGADFQGQLSQAIKEADLDSVRKEIDDINKSAKAHTSFDPNELMREKPKVETPSPYETVKVEPPQQTAVEPPTPPAPEVPPVILAHEPEKSAVGPT
jgi:sec-independent protein translocase protein TatB